MRNCVSFYLFLTHFNLQNQQEMVDLAIGNFALAIIALFLT